MDTRANGLSFIASVLAMIALLVVGLGIASWYTAGQYMIGPDGTYLLGSTSIGLATVEVCSYACASTWTYELDGFGHAATAALGLGIAFGCSVLWFANRRIAAVEVPVLVKLLGLALGAAALVASLLGMVSPPEALAFEISTALDLRSPEADRIFTFTRSPQLAVGGLLTIAGILLGGFVVWGARVPAPVEETEARPRALRRRPRRETARGPETDPFRAPPGPPPVAVVRHERPVPTPLIADARDEPPKLLR